MSEQVFNFLMPAGMGVGAILSLWLPGTATNSLPLLVASGALLGAVIICWYLAYRKPKTAE